MSTNDKLRQAFEQLIAAIAANDGDALAGVLSADVVDRSAGPDQPPGLAGVISWMRGIHTALSGLSGSVEDTVVEGDKVAGRLTWRATHTGLFMGLEATNKPIQMASIQILRFENGLAVEWWGIPDLYGVIDQLGGHLTPKTTERAGTTGRDGAARPADEASELGSLREPADLRTEE